MPWSWWFPFWRRKVTAEVSIQVMSDLHLEVGKQYDSFEFDKAAEYLLLAGDIGRLVDYQAYLRFLERQTARYERVFLVLGNHELYGGSHSAGLAKARRLVTEPSLQNRLVLLDQNRYDFPGTSVTILGCTLWSNIPDCARDTIAYKINDYQHIEYWTMDSHVSEHRLHLDWLKQQVREIRQETPSSPRTVIIATHYAPSLKKAFSAKAEKAAWSCGFATDVITGHDWRPVKYWVYGHTHFSNSFLDAGIRLVGNQRGYRVPGLECALGNQDPGLPFDPQKVIPVVVPSPRRRPTKVS